MSKKKKSTNSNVSEETFTEFMPFYSKHKIILFNVIQCLKVITIPDMIIYGACVFQFF